MTKRGFLADLFKGVNNESWDLARILAAWSVVAYSAAILGAYLKGQAFDFSALGVGFAAVLAGAGALIFAKDSARTAAVSAISHDKATVVVADAVADQVGRP